MNATFYQKQSKNQYLYLNQIILATHEIWKNSCDSPQLPNKTKSDQMQIKAFDSCQSTIQPRYLAYTKNTNLDIKDKLHSEISRRFIRKERCTAHLHIIEISRGNSIKLVWLDCSVQSERTPRIYNFNHLPLIFTLIFFTRYCCDKQKSPIFTIASSCSFYS